MATKLLTIGPSNGWFYAAKIYSSAEQKKILASCGANALEIALLSSDAPRAKNLIYGEKFDELEYLSLHFFDYAHRSDFYDQMENAFTIYNIHQPQTALIHPLGIPRPFWKRLISNYRLAIENMDKDKAKGVKLKDLLKKVRDYNLGFVLDVQHAYEHDHSMKYAQDLFDALKDRLKHIHLSGENSQTIHALLHQADNARTIIDFVGKLLSEKKVLLILEGAYLNQAELKREIEFARKELEC